MSNIKKRGVMIGRFSLPTDAHIKNAKVASQECDFLHILVGSANQRVSPKNPFTYKERKDMLIKSLWEAGVQNFRISPINDYRYNDTQWCKAVRETVAHYMNEPTKIVLYGHHKDLSSYYLDLFGEWERRELPLVLDGLSATDLRNTWLFYGQVPSFTISNLKGKAPQAVLNYLAKRDYDADLQSEYNFYVKEAERFKDYPYPDTLNFNCADAVVECAGNILVGLRKNAPGRNTWALFGGFKNRGETFLDCAIRELYEESNLRVPEKIVRSSIVNFKMYDSPNRSAGIQRNTMAYHIKIQPEKDGSLPRANGRDDIVKTMWVPNNELMDNYVMYDDHKDIVSDLTGAVQTPAYVKELF